jgi:hypothetical protein
MRKDGSPHICQLALQGGHHGDGGGIAYSQLNHYLTAILHILNMLMLV